GPGSAQIAPGDRNRALGGPRPVSPADRAAESAILLGALRVELGASLGADPRVGRPLRGRGPPGPGSADPVHRRAGTSGSDPGAAAPPARGAFGRNHPLAGPRGRRAAAASNPRRGGRAGRGGSLPQPPSLPQWGHGPAPPPVR